MKMIPPGPSITFLAASSTHEVPSYQHVARLGSCHPAFYLMPTIQPPSTVFQLSFFRALTPKYFTYPQPTILSASSNLLSSIASSS